MAGEQRSKSAFTSRFEGNLRSEWWERNGQARRVRKVRSECETFEGVLHLNAQFVS